MIHQALTDAARAVHQRRVSKVASSTGDAYKRSAIRDFSPAQRQQGQS